MRTILITGAAGFIGFHLCRKLFETNFLIVGLDNLNEYYDVNLKYSRLKKIKELSSLQKAKWEFIDGDICNKNLINKLFNKYRPEIVIHLAGQAGVRYSISNPDKYIESNINGFFNIIDNSKSNSVKNFLYASSSSVYGGNRNYPFSESDNVNHPVSLYAATKKSNELIAHSYSHIYGLSCTGLRFFTVYGPWGRPDMAPIIFTKAILENKPIKIFNYGEMFRDFTYIDDVIEMVTRLIEKPATSNCNFNKESPDPASSWCCNRIYNIGNNNPISIMNFIELLENELNQKAEKLLMPMQKGDVIKTAANTKLISNLVGKTKITSLQEGIKKFVDWYKEYYFL